MQIEKSLKENPNASTDNIFQPFRMTDDDLTYVQLGLILERILQSGGSAKFAQLVPKMPPVLLPGLPAVEIFSFQQDNVR